MGYTDVQAAETEWQQQEIMYFSDVLFAASFVPCLDHGNDRFAASFGAARKRAGPPGEIAMNEPVREFAGKSQILLDVLADNGAGLDPIGEGPGGYLGAQIDAV